VLDFKQKNLTKGLVCPTFADKVQKSANLWVKVAFRERVARSGLTKVGLGCFKVRQV
jgi:hypothetical protein